MKPLIVFGLSFVCISCYADGLVNPSLSSSSGGSGSGGATNGIQQSNGNGTNTTLVTPTLNNPTISGTITTSSTIVGFNTNGVSVYKPNTNTIVLLGFSFFGVNGTYTWDVTHNKYTNSGSFGIVGSDADQCYYITNGANFYYDTPYAQSEQDGTDFPINWYINGPNSSQSEIGTIPIGNGKFGVTTNIVARYVQTAPSTNTPTTLTGGLDISYITGGLNNVNIIIDTNYPNWIMGGINNTNAGFLSLIQMSQSCADYGIQDVINGCSLCTIFNSSGHNGLYSSESCIMNNAQGVCDIYGSEDATNFGVTGCGIETSVNCQIDYGVDFSQLLYGQNNYIGPIGGSPQFSASATSHNTGVAGASNTVYAVNTFVIGLRNSVSNLINGAVIGNNNNVTNATNSGVVGSGIIITNSGTWIFGVAGASLSVSNTTANLNATAIVIGNPTNSSSFVIVNTNWVSGLLYVNLTGRPIGVQSRVVLFNATTGIGSFAQMKLLIIGVMTNTVDLGFGALTSGVNSDLMIEGFVPAGNTFTFTNTSGGTGNTATISGGQYITY